MSDFKVINNCEDQKNIFLLYSTTCCHLCEEALEILDDLHKQMLLLAEEQQYLVKNESIYAVNLIDVAEDSQLMETYGPRIPVLSFPPTQEELAWPFDIQSAYKFILPRLSF